MNTRRIFKSALCLLLACTLMLCMCSCAFWKKTFSKPHEYMEYVEREAASEGVEAFVDYYDEVLASYGKDKEVAVKNEIKINIGDGLAQLLLLGTGMDLTWINDLTVKVDASKSGDLMKGFMGIVLDDDALISADMILKVKDGDAYFKIPEFSEKYIAMDFEEMMGVDMDALGMDTMNKIIEKLPEGNIIGDFINKYVGVIFDNITEAEKTKGTLDVNGKSEKCTILEIELTYAEFCELAKAIIRELQKDESIEELIHIGVDIINELASEGEKLDSTTVYADFITATNELLADIDVNDDEIEDDEIVLRWTDYVNGDSEIIGRKFYLYEAIELFYGKASEKEAYSEEFYVKEYCRYDGESEEYGEWSELISVKGEGTVKNNILTGEYDVYSEDEFLLNFTVSDIDMNAAEKGQMKSNIEIFPSAELFASEEDSMISAFATSLSFGIDYDYSENKQTVKIFVNNLDSEFLSLIVKTELVEIENISVPADSDVTDIETWAADADIDAFLEGLRNSALPADIVTMIEQLFYN